MISPLSLFAVVLVAFGMGSGGGTNQNGDIDAIVKRIRAVYSVTTSARIRFTQIETGGSTTGTLIYSTGDRFRLELPKQTIISDGRRSWTIFPDRNQVVIGRLSRRSDRLTPEQILTSFPGSYGTSLTGSATVNGRTTWVINCMPGSGPRIGDVSRAILYVDKSTFRFQRIDVTSASLGTIQIRIASAQYNSGVDNSSFTFSPPDGMRVVDLSR